MYFSFCILLSTSALLSGSAVFALSSATMKKVVVVGGGIQGASVAYHLAKKDKTVDVTVLEAVKPAAAASGKGGGFMARSWGNGSPTQRLHELAFDMYEDLAKTLDCDSYRKLPVLSVSPGYSGIKEARKKYGSMMPGWLDGASVGRISPMGMGDDTAQITPAQVVDKMLAAYPINTVIGQCVGIETDQGSGRGTRKVTGVQYIEVDDDGSKEKVLQADAVVIAAGPWSCTAENWFGRSGIHVELPMEGIKSTSIVWKKPAAGEVDATALFCGEDDRFGTHLEVYPRPDGTIYICGIGGSDYVQTNDLQKGAFLTDCNANDSRVEAASASFREMSSLYRKEGELDRSQACMRPCPPDALPYMGRIPMCEGAFINAGHNCWGIAWAPACGQAIAELVLDGESSSVDLRPFSPARFTSRAEKRGRKKQGTDVGEQW